MYDYNVHSTNNGNMIIDNIKADTDRKALNAARKKWGNAVTVSRV